MNPIREGIVFILDDDEDLEFHPLRTAHRAVVEQVADLLLPFIQKRVNEAYLYGYGIGRVDERDTIADALDEKGKSCRLYGDDAFAEAGYRTAAVDVRAGLGEEPLDELP